MSDQQLSSICGIVRTITYEDPMGKFSVIKLAISNDELVPVVGSLIGICIGQQISCNGSWTCSKSYGKQFVVEDFCISIPVDDVRDLERYLASGNLPGIGPVIANKLIQSFGKEIVHILDSEPDRLVACRGITKEKALKIGNAWKEQRQLCSLILFCQKAGLSSSQAKRIHERWGQEAEKLIRSNPYVLSKELWGFGFKRSDQVAKGLGISHDAPIRLQAALEAIVLAGTQEGHVCFPKTSLLLQAQKLLNFDHIEAITCHLQQLIDDKRLIEEDKEGPTGLESFIWSAHSHSVEHNIARQLERISNSTSRIGSFDINKAIIWAQREINISLAEEQQQAIELAFTKKIQILTGGPGTGKSTITKLITTIAKQLGLKYIFCAPTGKAAMRLSETSGCPAKTIHYLLEYDFVTQAFRRNQSMQLDVDIIIVDEMSMVDCFLFHNLLKAIPSYAHVVLLGDPDQLESIGPGNILEDLLSSNRIHSCKLVKIFRQSERSSIIKAAYLIRSGQSPLLSQKDEDTIDFQFIEEQDGDKIAEKICQAVYTDLPSQFGLNPQEDIQVLCPMRKGPAGIDRLNSLLQSHYQRGSQTHVAIGSRTFYPSDKLIQTRNNYRKEIFNGSIGFLDHIHTQNKTCDILFQDGRTLTYTFKELEQIQHAYALSVHKYQGSESECIVMPIHGSHMILLFRKLLYTAVTRARKHVLLIGSKYHLRCCVRQIGNTQRYTGLRKRLEDLLPIISVNKEFAFSQEQE